jgi:hypothetical protein
MSRPTAACWGKARRAFLVALLVFGGTACSARVPVDIGNACAIFGENRAWYRASRDVHERWGTPIEVQLAIIHQESGFRPKARPPRRRFLWIFPGPRPSNAFGYAQALESTWDAYRKATGNRGADRDDYEDAVDFIGWYTAESRRACGIRRDDVFSLYLAYHEGNGGFRRGTHRRKQWLLDTARRVERRAASYRTQLAGCEKKLARRRFLWIF